MLETCQQRLLVSCSISDDRAAAQLSVDAIVGDREIESLVVDVTNMSVESGADAKIGKSVCGGLLVSDASLYVGSFVGPQFRGDRQDVGVIIDDFGLANQVWSTFLGSV